MPDDKQGDKAKVKQKAEKTPVKVELHHIIKNPSPSKSQGENR